MKAGLQTAASAGADRIAELVSLLAKAFAGRWIRAMALIGSLSAVRAQAPGTTGFATAFAYVAELLRPDSEARIRLRGMARGDSQRIELGGGVFAMEQAYETKPRSEGFFESHRKFIDIQVVVEGEEMIEVVDASRIDVREPYAEERDLITYRDARHTSRLCLLAGEAAIFFPVDVHMPCLMLNSSPVLVRKSVVKVPVG